MKYYCFRCGEELTPENNGILINDGEFAQCDDCHEIEFGCYIWPILLLYDNNIVKRKVKMEEELKIINERLNRIYDGKNPLITIYGDGSWSVEIDGTYSTANGEKPCRIDGKASGSSITELYEFLKNPIK